MLVTLIGIVACSTTTEDPATPSAQACTGGGCTSSGAPCATNKRDCNGNAADECEVDIANDPSNCGACGTQCPAGGFCADGKCVDKCPAEKTTCGRACVDLKSDTAHCGACNNACAAGEACVDRVCGGACTETPCKMLLPQCGCPTGQGCYADDQGARACLAAGKIGEAQVCTDDTACIPGYACREKKKEGVAVLICERMCLVDADCKGDGSLCTDQPKKGFKGCSISCNPVAQTGCGTGSKCVITVLPSQETYTDCSPLGGTKQQGATCTLGSNQCAPGLFCVGDQKPSGLVTFCAKYCTSTADCPQGTTCEAKQALKNSTTSYGACFPP
jgi:hypothetical protein